MAKEVEGDFRNWSWRKGRDGGALRSTAGPVIDHSPEQSSKVTESPSAAIVRAGKRTSAGGKRSEDREESRQPARVTEGNKPPLSALDQAKQAGMCRSGTDIRDRPTGPEGVEWDGRRVVPVLPGVPIGGCAGDGPRHRTSPRPLTSATVRLHWKPQFAKALRVRTISSVG